ncbi:MAG: putative polysaccharide deacetylase/methyltransferase protein, partial [Novosphingobium sp.]|nr:putative polysaccharide deacetylase/methyltransferase protein [Novosphingobium sp.]
MKAMATMTATMISGGAGPPQVSFIIPAFNAARTLKITARSLRAQTLREWEAVIVDDGSTDRTAKVAAALVRADARFKLVTQKNSGASAARNTGLAHASARLVTFIDADDWIAPDFLASLVPLAAEPDVLAFCAYERILPSGRVCPPDFCGMLQDDPLAVLAFRCEPAIHCVVAPRELVTAVG